MSDWTSAGFTPSVKRCSETRAHYAHEWYNPLRIQCPGGPDEGTELADLRAKVERVQALADGPWHWTTCPADCERDHRRPDRRDLRAALTPEPTP